MAVVRAVFAALALAACVSTGAAPSGEHTAPRGPSPRPECAAARVLIYFTEDSATLQPLSQPLLRDLMERVAACEAAGGSLQSLAIVAYPDAGVRPAQASLEIAAREQRVRAALIELGAPADRIAARRGVSQRGAPMQRRAEVIADLW